MQLTRQKLLGAIATVTGLGLVQLPSDEAMAHLSSPATAGGSVAPLAACPIAGPNQFIDSWGDSRSGGRRHEGVDMEGVRGTSVVAVRSGEAEFKKSNLGGYAVWLLTAAGDRFYYAHLDRWEGSSRPVAAGEVIGYVGSSGNAQGDHLHFETRRGEDALNPYPLVRDACQARRVDVIPRAGGTPVAY